VVTGWRYHHQTDWNKTMSDDDLDLDYDTFDEIDDADDDSLHALIKDRTTGDYGWHWIYRDDLAEHGLQDVARHGMVE
jgi:hypothetical protein